MSAFETRIPTAAELADHEEKEVAWVHLTSSETWDPQAKSFSHVEASLKDALVRGTNLHQQASRSPDPLQVRGLESVSQGKGTGKPKVAFADDATVATVDSTDVESLGEPYTSPRDVSSIHISNLRQEQGHTTALDVDRHAGYMLNECGVRANWTDLFQGEGEMSDFLESEFGETVARHLDAGHTIKQRPGFIDANKLAKNWKTGKELA